MKHVSFDKDGTLIDVHRYWAHIIGLRATKLRGEWGLPPAAEEDLVDSMGVNRTLARIKRGGPVGYDPRSVIIQAARDSLQRFGASASSEQIAALFKDVDVKQQREGDYVIAVLPGVEEGLQRLRSMGVVMTVYSSDRSANTDHVLRTLGLRELFAGITGGDTVQRAKPDPEGFLTLCDAVGAGPKDSVYIGDTCSDMRMAKAGGSHGVGVATGLASLQDLADCGSEAHPTLLDWLDSL